MYFLQGHFSDSKKGTKRTKLIFTISKKAFKNSYSAYLYWTPAIVITTAIFYAFTINIILFFCKIFYLQGLILSFLISTFLFPIYYCTATEEHGKTREKKFKDQMLKD